jgi:iron transport multicopper oxidase
VTGYLIYNNNPTDLPSPALLDDFEPFDDFTLVPKDHAPLLPAPATQVPLTVVMANLGDGASYAFFNNISYVVPKVPTLYTALTTGDAANNPFIYGPNTNAFVLNAGDIIDIIVNNNDTGKHPFHLHGHNFQAIARGDDDSGNYVGNETFPAVPMRRDTFMLRPMANIVLRFRADNPDK